MRSFQESILHLKSLNFNPKTIVDVGVSYGTPELYDNYPDAYYIFVEPLDELEDRLKLLCKKFKGEYHILALADIEGEALFFVPEKHEGASLKFANVSQVEKLRKIKLETLDNLIADRDLESPILVKTDCQGGDIDVIKGGSISLEIVDMVIMEVQLFYAFGKHKDNTVSLVISYMYEKGFVVYDFIHYKTRPYDNALGQINVVFVKEKSDLRKYHFWQ